MLSSLFFFFASHFLSLSFFSLSPQVVTQIRGHTAASSPPPSKVYFEYTSTCLAFWSREYLIPFFPRRLASSAPTYANIIIWALTTWFLPFFLPINFHSHHGGIRTPGSTLLIALIVQFHWKHETTGATGSRGGITEVHVMVPTRNMHSFFFWHLTSIFSPWVTSTGGRGQYSDIPSPLDERRFSRMSAHTISDLITCCNLSELVTRCSTLWIYYIPATWYLVPNCTHPSRGDRGAQCPLGLVIVEIHILRPQPVNRKINTKIYHEVIEVLYVPIQKRTYRVLLQKHNKNKPTKNLHSTTTLIQVYNTPTGNILTVRYWNQSPTAIIFRSRVQCSTE